jgi:tRNA(Phe) wybutosine-synthesizing methylase Tyw3
MLLHCATSVGYRESGMSISGAATPKEKIIVAVRTTAIRLEIPLATCDVNGRIRPFGLSQEYLNTLVKLVNDKFEENEVRKKSLLASLRLAFEMRESQSMDGITQTETKDERRIRKRKEGLMLQQAASRIKGNSAREAQDLDDHPDELSPLPIDIA